MSDAFHVSMNPGVLNAADGTLTIEFDDPLAASDVTVTLLETDRWGDGAEQVVEPGPGRDEMVAVFHGAIVDSRFQGGITRQAPARAGRPQIQVQLGDAPAARVNIPNGGNETERGVLELVVTVAGRIGGRRKTYRTANPVFVRSFVDTRPVLAIITGQDRRGSRNQYFTAARKYWRQHADAVISMSNVQDILDFVRTAPDRQGYGPWGEINIVDHGDEREWIISLFHGAAREHVTAERLNDLLVPRDGRFTVPATADLDAQSKVLIRGCAIGNDQALLDNIRALFGGQASVFAPKMIQEYTWETHGREVVTHEGFWEYFFLDIPSFGAPVDDRWIDLLSAEFSGKATRDQWRAMLHDPHRRGGLIETIKYEFDYNAPLRPVDFDYLADMRRTFPDNNPTIDWNRYGWGVNRPPRSLGQRQETYRMTARGNRYHIDCRRPYLNADGSPVQPDINSSDHYGRSPAW